MYDKIYEFCAVRNEGGAHKNGDKMPPRVEWIVNFLLDNDIKFEVDEFTTERFGPDNKFFNIVMLGSSNRMVVAHHDVVNVRVDNANDNSCSVINAIAVKMLMPEMNVILLDGEEPPMMGVGSTHAARRTANGDFGDIEWVLNFELTGKGGKNFFIGNYPGPLSDRIVGLFNCPIFNTPFNDAVMFRNAGIDSVVINPLPVTDKVTGIKNENGYLEHSMLFNCHTARDTVDTIDPADMKAFVEEVVLVILGDTPTPPLPPKPPSYKVAFAGDIEIEGTKEQVYDWIADNISFFSNDDDYMKDFTVIDLDDKTHSLKDHPVFSPALDENPDSDWLGDDSSTSGYGSIFDLFEEEDDGDDTPPF